MQLIGIHHLTAVTGNAAENVAFYADALGMRLVKKTVNQDDTSAYHLFYGDERGRPGTEVTFFDWPQLRIAANHPGAGEVSTTELRVSDRAALEWWVGRFDELGVQHAGLEERDGRSYLDFTDPEGQRLRLSEDRGEGVPGGVPWENAPVPPEAGIRGLGAVDLTVAELRPTAWVLTEVLGFRQTDERTEDGGRTVTFEVGKGGPGATVQIDRYYFRSIYFREPGGVLFEIATDGPGFVTDEDAEHLGERLSLPPFLEERREEIEAGLDPITVEGWTAQR